MGALYRVATVLRPRSTVRPPWLLLAGCGVLVAACAGRRTPSEDLLPRELLVEVLPPGAEVSLDGRPLGAGSRAIPAPPAGEHLLRIEADGYEPAEQTLPEGSLAGVRVAAALRPVGLWSALDYDDPETLALAAAHLVRLGSAGDAAAYAERAIALERETALAHRALGDARAALGDARRAAAAWAEYLRLAPDAPDAAAVAERVDAVRVEAALPAR
jgi:tetratricopeptide (TPR) repeat protein